MNQDRERNELKRLAEVYLRRNDPARSNLTRVLNEAAEAWDKEVDRLNRELHEVRDELQATRTSLRDMYLEGVREEVFHMTEMQDLIRALRAAVEATAQRVVTERQTDQFFWFDAGAENRAWDKLAEAMKEHLEEITGAGDVYE